MSDWPWFILVAMYGACVGSFVNVLIHRLPQGRSVVTPRSSCPGCGHGIAWFDNIPILSWLLLRGRCRSCGAAISIQYPCVETVCAALFAGVYWLDYASGLRPHLMAAGFMATWPVLLTQLVLVAGLLAATMIDARFYIIPLRIPQTVTLVALVVLPVAAIWLEAIESTGPVVEPAGMGMAVGGIGGLTIALLLLHLHLLPRSFDEVEEVLDEDQAPDAFLSHPHPRREVLKECLFVVLPLVGAVAGYSLMFVSQDYVAAGDQYPLALRVLGGVVCGYLVGGGVVWGIRILGTLVFGREAMGLGDVHLLGAIGAVMGAQDAVAVFFIAPFFGLGAAAVQGGLQRLWHGKLKVIPYGPYLSLAALAVMALRQPLWDFFGIF